jgi:sodium/potassium/calcium exchanger 2
MAIGGSAPEFFTSLIGIFLAKTHIGFGTIVGSAVFNILVVIGLCAFITKGKDKIKLSSFSLYRDCSFYLVTLVLLAVFFSDKVIRL